MAVGGECRSVGIAGGYIFAGGHAPTSSKLGLGADGILEIQGILANGTTFTATPSQHQDLYWFLSGSGAGGTVAYIKSVTFRIFKDFSVSGSILTFNYTDVLTEKEFWPFIDLWQRITPKIADAGAYAYAFYKTGYFQNLSKAFKPLFDDGATMVEAIMNPNPKAANAVASNSVLPAWRNNIIDVVVGKAYNDSAPFQQMADDRKYITQHWTCALEALAPVSEGGGSCMNQADAENPKWQASFYGYYKKQLLIKSHYDPTGVWYAKTAVGSEYWADDAKQRLCSVTPFETT